MLLVQRHDELPKLVEVCKQYMQYEGGTLERVMRARAGVDAARSSGNMGSLGAAERELRSGLTGLYAVAENYPQLKASEPFRHLQERISGLETAIADRREVYNEAANTNNVRIASFPDVLVAASGDFPPAQLLHFETDQKADVDLQGGVLRAEAAARVPAAAKPSPPYPVIALVAAALAVLALWRFFVRLRRDRLVADTPAARIRSAAQGYVKVTGRAQPAGPAPTAAPLSSRPCVWWAYEIAHEERDAKGNTPLADRRSGQQRRAVHAGRR